MGNRKVEKTPAVRERAARRQAAEDLIYLTSCAVNEEKTDPERCKKTDLHELYRQSQRHLLTAAVSFALEEVMELPRAFDQAKKKAIRKQALFDIERAAVTAELDAAGIWYLPLKGVLLKDDYPKTAMRQMSDNDILIDETRAADVRKIMERLGYRCESYGEWHHDAYSKPPTLEFEIHRSLFNEENSPLLSTYFADISIKLLSVGSERRMTDEDFYLYLLSHTYQHYIHAGTGLRSLLDIYVFLRAHPEMDTAYLTAELEKLSLRAFEERIRCLAQKVFSGAPLNDSEAKELEYFIHSGSYGDAKNAAQNHLARDLDNDDSRRAKRRYLKKRFFISGDVLKKDYPFVAKHKSLYPLLLIYRPLKSTMKHPGAILKEYRSLRKFKKSDVPHHR